MERTNRILSEAEVSPNYQKLLDLGDAQNVGDILAAGSESAVEKRLRSFADAGVTDLSVRVVPIGQGRDELIASSQRTRELLASLAGAFYGTRTDTEATTGAGSSALLVLGAVLADLATLRG